MSESEFKTPRLTYKSLNGQVSAYLAEMIHNVDDSDNNNNNNNNNNIFTKPTLLAKQFKGSVQ